MADSNIDVTPGSGASVDTRTEATNGNHRQVVVIGDPATNAGVAPVDATAGIKVDLGADNDVTATGNVAHDAADSGNPQKVGGRARSSEITAVASDDRSDFITDLVGKQIVIPYANPENFVSGVTAAITNTTNTSVIAAQGAGVRTYVTSILVTNSHATVSTVVEIKDGTTVIWRGYALAAGGGFSVTFPTPLKTTANTALNAACVTTGSNVYVSATGYKGV